MNKEMNRAEGILEEFKRKYQGVTTPKDPESYNTPQVSRALVLYLQKTFKARQYSTGDPALVNKLLIQNGVDAVILCLEELNNIQEKHVREQDKAISAGDKPNRRV